MNTLIAYFAGMLFVTGLINLVKPSIFIDYVRQQASTLGFLLTAIAVRLILGVTLILVAEESKYPVFISFIGLMSLAGAVIVAVLGRENFAQLVTRITAMNPGFARFGGFMSILVSGFLLYAVL